MLMVHLLNGAYEINVNKNRAESRFIAVIFVIYKHAELSLFGSFLVLFPLARRWCSQCKGSTLCSLPGSLARFSGWFGLVLAFESCTLNALVKCSYQ